MVAEKKLYDAYCEWLFSIFFVLQERIDLSFADDYHKRVFGFISEFLLYVWVTARKLKAYECKVAIIGEKKETNEVTKKIAEFFRKKDAAGAKAYFETVLKQRPDIIMEASDINGECKICLQAVSTANLELAQYGRSFLDYINDYPGIINYFRSLNSVASNAVREAGGGTHMLSAKTEYARTIEEKSSSDAPGSLKPWTTDIAIRAAVRLYARSQKMADEAYKKIKTLKNQ